MPAAVAMLGRATARADATGAQGRLAGARVRAVVARPSAGARVGVVRVGDIFKQATTVKGGGSGGSGGGGGGGGGGGDGAGDSGNNGEKWLKIGGAALTATAVAVGTRRAHKTSKSTGDPFSVGEAMEQALETLLFSSRYFVLLAVFGSITMGATMFFKGALSVQKAVQALLTNKGGEVSMRSIASLDEFLTGCASLVFGLGLYELFISKIDVARKVVAGEHKGFLALDHKPSWLHVEGLHDLKHKTGAVVVMVMVVNLFEAAKKMTFAAPIDLAYFSAAILLSSLSVFVMGIEIASPEEKEEEEPKKAAEKKK